MTSLKIGDTVTIRRGRLKGKPGTVETISNSQVVVKLEDGTLELHNETNLKAPDEATIGAQALADVIGVAAAQYPEADVDAEGPIDALKGLANYLGKFLPGFSAESVTWPVPAGDDGGPDFVA